MYVINFSPPMSGLFDSFNTFRLGVRYSKLLKVGDRVLLINAKSLEVIGEAIVNGVIVGQLGVLAGLYAHENHNQRDSDSEGAKTRLIANMTKRYGPHLVNETKKVTVIQLTMVG